MFQLSADAAALTGIGALFTGLAALIWAVRRDRSSK